MSKFNDQIWYEKFRPKKISDLVLPDKHARKFKRYMKSKTIPHLLFHGPPGSGKTTIGEIFVKALADKSLKLNGSSSDRGVNTVKTRVKNFAKTMRTSKRKKNIVFIDEADGMTIDAQRALKNTIEKYQDNCRFIFTCNEIDKMDDAIISRCSVFWFSTLPDDEISAFLSKILDDEDVEYKSRDLEKIINLFKPDVRKIINNVQNASFSGTLRPDDVISIFDEKVLTKYVLKGNLAAIRKLWTGMTDFVWFYKHLFNKVLPEIKEKHQKAVAYSIAEHLWRDSNIADREINASACCLDICDILDINITI